MGNDSRFRRRAEIVGSALAVCEKIYQGSLATGEIRPDASRMATQPLEVLSDMVDILMAAAVHLKEEEIRESET